MPSNQPSAESPSEPEAPTRVLAGAIPSLAAMRDALVGDVLRDLLGPAGGADEEIDEQRASERYLVGVLAPAAATADRFGFADPVETDEADAGEADDGAPGTVGLPDPLHEDSLNRIARHGADDGDEPADDPTPSADGAPQPSSLGLTFGIAAECTHLRVTARWGVYERVDSDTALNEKTGEPKKVWKRTPREGCLEIDARRPGVHPELAVCPEQPDVRLQVRVLERPARRMVSIFLTNHQERPDRLRDSACLFQVELSVEDGVGRSIFVRSAPARELTAVDPELRQELRTLEMLYRSEVEFALGHGVSVHAEVDPGNPLRATRLTTRFVPMQEVARHTSPTPEDSPELAAAELRMATLAAMDPASVRRALQPLLDAYRSWIDRRITEMEADPTLTAYAGEARDSIERCRRALERMDAGLTLLAADPMAAEAFAFANRAMDLQRRQSLLARDHRSGTDAPLHTPDPAWYPFQLGFILLNLPSLTDPVHPERSDPTQAVADLLWFPTGGGKTEAYLGLTAYTLALRRLRGVRPDGIDSLGVAVLMRYTLRLLTLQQFQRAAVLICACEQIRRSALERGDTRWGVEPFRVGLWVGSKVTPNDTESSRLSVESMRDRGGHGFSSRQGSPLQLGHCPWCGAEIHRGRNIVVSPYKSGAGRTLIYCGDPLGTCLFTAARSPEEGIPVLTVDEEIYRLLPALLIATVDKFAQMPWRGEVGMLFGQVSGRCNRHGFRSPEVEDTDRHPARPPLPAARTLPLEPLRPPDLIIQDELHLISGPLGSLVGLYETAIDELCTWEHEGRRVRPKVIASTATIRQASEQVRRLYLRRVAVFPPNGLSAGDSFFAIRREPSERHPGRLYLGISAPGRKLQFALIRLYLALLSASQVQYERGGARADPWMTLVAYFNSMRELGGTRRLVEDDINSRLRMMGRRGLPRRLLRRVEELTSRIAATDVRTLLDAMELGFGDVGERGSAAPHRSERPIDVLLATNMLSVGVDVSRLGLMAVTGQPKTTAEYIQATSRVGRAAPGLICTLYHWTRPRDLSHYERFEHYHATFYRHVEALSVTPFAPRALDRALSGLLVSLIRQSQLRWNHEDGAEPAPNDLEAVECAMRAILNRAEAITGRPDTVEMVRRELDHRLRTWRHRADPGPGHGRLTYAESRAAEPIARPLLTPPGPGPWQPFTCLTSLRDVEVEAPLILRHTGIGGREPVRDVDRDCDDPVQRVGEEMADQESDEVSA